MFLIKIKIMLNQRALIEFFLRIRKCLSVFEKTFPDWQRPLRIRKVNFLRYRKERKLCASAKAFANRERSLRMHKSPLRICKEKLAFANTQSENLRVYTMAAGWA